MKHITVFISILLNLFVSTFVYADGINNIFSNLNVVDVTKNGVSSSATDNATALQAAINLAVANKQALYIPSASTCYKYTAPLTISGNLTIIGDASGGNWAGTNQINVPSATPNLQGSVLCPSSNGSNAIDISGTALNINIRNLSILFQTLYTGTGNGISYVPAGTTQGLSGSFWENVNIYGHDGNHYAVALTNPIYNTLIHVQGFGGGLLKLFGNGGALHFGNTSYIEFYCNLFLAGSADCYNIGATGTQQLNLEAFIRPQANVNNLGIGTPPTSAQLIWNQDANVTNVNVFAADWETNVGSPLAIGNPTSGGIDWNSFFTTTSAIRFTEPSTVGTGIIYNPKYNAGAFTNTTASGTVAVEALFNITGWTLTSSNATTYTVACTFCVAPPIAGTNSTFGRTAAIYATGEIFTTTDISANGGAFITGTTQLNLNGSANTQIASGVNSGTVTIGNSGNTGKTVLAGLSTGTNADFLCLSAGGVVLLQTTACTISSARFKKDILPVSDKSSLADVLKLKPVSFTMKETNRDPNAANQQVGLLAEDVAAVDTKLAVYEDDMKTPKSYRQEAVIAKLIGAIHELHADNNNLRACNDNWKCRIFGIR